MKITFLGTGTSQGVPIIGCQCTVCKSTDEKDKRLRTSIMIEAMGSTFVIDSGPDFRQQLLREDVRRMDALIFTHEHKDHTAGMDDVRAFNYLTGKEVDIYATERVQEVLRREFRYIFSGDDYPGIPKVKLHTIHNAPFEINGVRFIPIEVMHYKLPVLGFRVGDFTYITDANFISDIDRDKIRGSRIIAINALRKEKHISHFTLKEAVDVLTDLAPEQGYLLHISHQLGKHEDINRELPAFVRCAHDGLKIEVGS